MKQTHSHVFGQDRVKAGERRTMMVIAITGVMMIVEVIAGILFGSMALLADGLHMASHAVALGITWFAYVFARRHAHDERFSFGTGKVNSLAAFASAILLAGFAAGMAWESGLRFLHPVAIAFDSAILVAVIGLIVNAASVFILGGKEPAEDHEHGDHGHHQHGDHNLRAAYLHVLADAVTSLTAIFALLTGKYLGWTWMDPAMGIAGALLVARWSWGLLRDASRVLLDRQAPDEMLAQVREALGNARCRVTDLHVWSIGPGIYAAAVSVVTEESVTAESLKRRLPRRLVHVTVEVNHGASVRVEG